jgi:hypothetical protein
VLVAAALAMTAAPRRLTSVGAAPVPASHARTTAALTSQARAR